MLRYAVPIIFLLTQELEPPRKVARAAPPAEVGVRSQKAYQVRRDTPKPLDINQASAVP